MPKKKILCNASNTRATICHSLKNEKRTLHTAHKDSINWATSTEWNQYNKTRIKPNFYQNQSKPPCSDELTKGNEMTLCSAEPLGEERAEEGVAALDVRVVHAPVTSQDPLRWRLHALGTILTEF